MATLTIAPARAGGDPAELRHFLDVRGRGAVAAAPGSGWDARLAELERRWGDWRSALPALPPELRSVAALRFVDRRTLVQTAAALGVGVGTVQRRERAALDALARALAGGAA